MLNSTWASNRATTGAVAALQPLTRERIKPSCLSCRTTLMKSGRCWLVSSTNLCRFSDSSALSEVNKRGIRWKVSSCNIKFIPYTCCLLNHTGGLWESFSTCQKWSGETLVTRVPDFYYILIKIRLYRLPLRPLRELLTWTETLRTSDTNICQRSVIFGVSTAVCWWLLPFYLSPVLFVFIREKAIILSHHGNQMVWRGATVNLWENETSKPLHLTLTTLPPYYIPHTTSKRSL